MPKAKTKLPVLYPVTIRKNVTWVERKEYIQTRSEQLSKTLKTALSAKAVEQLLKSANEQVEPSGDGITEEVISAYRAIEADVRAAVENLKEREAEVAKQEAAAEAEKAKKQEQEIEVLEAALAVDKIDQSLLAGKFDSDSTGVTVHKDATVAEVAQLFSLSVFVNDVSAWKIGDLGKELVDRGFENVIDNFCAKTGRSGSTIYGYIKLARSIPREKRSVNVLPTTCLEIVNARLSDDPKKDEKLKDKLLATADKEGWSRLEARSHVDAVREVPKKRTGGTVKTEKKAEQESKENPRYAVVDLNDVENNSYVAEDVSTQEIAENFVIDFETRTFGTISDTGAIVWKEFQKAPAVTEGEPVPA